MILMFFGKPVELIIIYGALGALFMPFLAVSLLILLNSKSVLQEYRNKLASNLVLVGCLVLFAFLCIKELFGIFAG
jgi:Mn2+/Fe2+ NRAMP family transporter